MAIAENACLGMQTAATHTFALSPRRPRWYAALRHLSSFRPLLNNSVADGSDERGPLS